MLLGRFSDWRLRYVAMRELKQRDRVAEAEHSDSSLNLLHKAAQALQADDLVVASRYWEEARLRYPDHCLKSEAAIGVLLGLKRFDELESLMKKGHRLWPRNKQYMSGLALVGERRQDFEQGATWWLKVHNLFPHERNAYINGSACLRRLNRLEEAAALLKTGTQYLPSDREVWAASGATYEEIQNFTAALRCYDCIADKLWHSSGSQAGARVCIAQGDFDGAGKRLAEGHRRHPQDPDIIIELARYSERVADLEGAANYWKHLRLTFPARNLAYEEEVRCLLLLDRIEEASLVSAEAERRFACTAP